MFLEVGHVEHLSMDILLSIRILTYLQEVSTENILFPLKNLISHELVM